MFISSRTSGADHQADRVKRIAGVIGDPESRLDTAATASSASANIASDHSIAAQTISPEAVCNHSNGVIRHRSHTIEISSRWCDVAAD